MLISAGFSDTSNDKYEKYYPLSDCSIVVDFRNKKVDEQIFAYLIKKGKCYS